MIMITNPCIRFIQPISGIDWAHLPANSVSISFESSQARIMAWNDCLGSQGGDHRDSLSIIETERVLAGWESPWGVMVPVSAAPGRPSSGGLERIHSGRARDRAHIGEHICMAMRYSSILMYWRTSYLDIAVRTIAQGRRFPFRDWLRLHMFLLFFNFYTSKIVLTPATTIYIIPYYYDREQFILWNIKWE